MRQPFLACPLRLVAEVGNPGGVLEQVLDPDPVAVGVAGDKAGDGSSSFSFPRSASSRIAAAVNALVTEAMWNRLAGELGTPSS